MTFALFQMLSGNVCHKAAFILICWCFFFFYFSVCFYDLIFSAFILSSLNCFRMLMVNPLCSHAHPFCSLPEVVEMGGPLLSPGSAPNGI